MEYTLPDGFFWVSQQPYKVIFAHKESGKTYGVRTFVREGLDDGARKEIDYGVAKITREIERDRSYLENNQDNSR